MQNNRPEFLCVGAHKAGTTWLHYQLSQHKQIWMPPLKELHFFDRSTKYPSPNYLSVNSPASRFWGTQPWENKRMLQVSKYCMQSALGFQFKKTIWWSKLLFGHYDNAWYCNLFSQAKPHQKTGEITPSYSILESEDIAKIKEINPHMKLIFLIRNPIDRAWSAIRFNSDRGYSDVDLESSKEIIQDLRKAGTILRGDYERTLDVYLEHFDSDQILVCFYDAIQKDPVNLVSSITEFLGIESFEKSSINNRKRFNKSPQSLISKDVTRFLNEAYGPMIERLAARFGSYAIFWKTEVESLDNPLYIQPQVEQFRPTLHP